MVVVIKAVVETIVVVVGVVVKHESYKGLFTPKILRTPWLAIDQFFDVIVDKS